MISPLITANIDIPGSARVNPLYNCPLGIISNTTALDIKNTSDFRYQTEFKSVSEVNNTNENLNINYRGTFCKFRVDNTPTFSFNSSSGLTLVDLKCAVMMEPSVTDPSNPNFYSTTDKYAFKFKLLPFQKYICMLNPLYRQLNELKSLKVYDKLPNGTYKIGSEYMSPECLKGFTFEAPVHTNVYLSFIATFSRPNSTTPIVIKQEYKTNGTWINTGPNVTLSTWQEYPYFYYSDYFNNNSDIASANNTYNCTGTTGSVVSYSAPANCNSSQQFRVAQLPDAPEEVIEPLLVFPNPNSGTFNISLNFKELGSTQISIYNGTGYVIMNKNLNEIDVHTEIIELDESAQGFYIIKVVHNGNEFYKKVTINN
jgi:hypothetical protein